MKKFNLFGLKFMFEIKKVIEMMQRYIRAHTV